MSKEIKITLIHSPIGRSRRQKDTVKALGFTKLNQTVSQPDSPVIRGMIAKVSHLLRVEETGS